MALDLTSILSAAPQVISLLKSVIETFGSISPPHPAPAVVPPGAVAHPSQAIKDLQNLLNAVVKPTPPLEADGWLGPQTEAVIETAIALLKTKGIG